MRYFEERNELTSNYALALFEVAQEQNKDIIEIINDLEVFYSVLKVKGVTQLKTLLSYPLISVEEKITSIHDAFDGNIDKLVIDFIISLTQAQRLSFLSLIIKEFKMIYRNNYNIIKVQAKFGLEPSEKQINDIKNAMKEKLGCAKIEFEYIVEPSLIGGVKLFYNGKFIDNTLAAKIKRYAQQIRA